MQEINMYTALKNIVEYLNSNPTHRIYPNTPLHTEAILAFKKENEFNQQELTFKVATLFEQGIDCKYANTDVMINAYEIESWLNSAIEGSGLMLIISDRHKFERTLGNPFDI